MDKKTKYVAVEELAERLYTTPEELVDLMLRMSYCLYVEENEAKQFIDLLFFIVHEQLNLVD